MSEHTLGNTYCNDCGGFVDKFGVGHRKACTEIKRLKGVEAENRALRQRLENIIELGNLALSVEDASALILRGGIDVMMGEANTALEGRGE